MAEFNPKQQEFQAPQYTGASRGLDYKADTSKGMLVEGFGKAFEGLIKGLDEGVQENIRQDTQKGFDAINKEFGVDAAVATMGHPQPGPNDIANQTAENQPTPETIRRAGDQLRSLSAAAAQSPTLEAHFGARMTSLVRQLRGKYPGYRTQIDEIVSNVTGMRPANYLRNELFQEIQRGVGQTQKDRDATIKYARDHGYLGGVQWRGSEPFNPETNQPLTLAEVNARIADGQARKATVAQQNAELELNAKQGTLDVKQNTQVFTDRVTSHVNNKLNNAIGETGQNWKKIVESVNNMNAGLGQGQMPNPQEIAQTLGLLNNLKTQIGLEITGIYSAPFAEGSNMSFATNLKPEDAEKIKDQAMMPLKMLEEALTKGDASLIKVAATFLETQKNANVAGQLKRYPVLQTVQAARSIYGDQAVSGYMMNQPTVRSALIDSVRTTNRVGALNDDPRNPQKSLIEDLKTAKDQNLASPDLTKAHIDSWLAEVRNPKAVDDKLLSQLSVYMFGTKNLGLAQNMTAADRQSFLTQVSSPEVTARMLQLKQSYPQAWSAYQAWTMSTAQAVVKDSVDELQKFNLDRREIMFAWNPQTHRFQTVQNPSAGDRYRTPDGKIDPGALTRTMLTEGALDFLQYGGATQRYAQAISAVEKLNQTISAIAPIIVDHQQDVGVQMNTLLRALGARSPNGVTTTDFLLEALTRAQAAAEVQPSDQPFRQPIDIWKLTAPFTPVWEDAQGLSIIGVEHDRTINSVMPLNAVPNAAPPQDQPLKTQNTIQPQVVPNAPVAVPESQRRSELSGNTPDEEIPATPQTPRQMPSLTQDQFPGYVPKDKRPTDKNDPYYTKPVGKYRSYVPDSAKLTQADLDEAADSWNVPAESINPASLPKEGKQSFVPNAPAPVMQAVLPSGKSIEQVVVDATAAGKQLTTVLAEQFIDLHENNAQHAKTLVTFFKNMGVGLTNPAAVPWCAAFVDSIVKASGEAGTGSLLARSFLKWGNPVKEPQRGDVVVIQRGSRNGPLGHVGFFDGYDKDGNVLVLGGNQNNKVSVAPFPPDSILGFRRPKSLDTMTNADKQFLSTVAQQGASANRTYRPTMQSTR